MEGRNSILTKQELEIVHRYLDGISIRQLSMENKGFGRTKISNLIEIYRRENPELSEKISELKIKAKTHKADVSKYTAEPLTEEQITEAYSDIMRKGKTLTQVAKDFKRTRDFVKKQILHFLDDKEEEQEFLEQLEKNQHQKNTSCFDSALTEDDKKNMIFDRLNSRRSKNNRRIYSEHLLERKYNRLKEYFLVARNQSCKQKLTEEDFFRMLYDTPTLLSSSLSSKIIPAIKNLDNNPDVGIENATTIIKSDASILLSAIDRTNLQIRILKENDLLQKCYKKPRNFRTSPELMYALIQFKKFRSNAGIDGVGLEESDVVFLSRRKLFERYSRTPEQLLIEYDIKKQYGDDEYFDK